MDIALDLENIETNVKPPYSMQTHQSLTQPDATLYET
jgi:hypothetical protein